MPSYSVRRRRIKEFKEVAGSMPDSVCTKVLENNNWNVSQAMNDFFENRWKYPEAKTKEGDKGKLKKVFKTYADKEDPEIMSQEGTMKFFKDNDIDPDSHQTLVVSWLLSCEEMGIILENEFIEGFSKQGSSSKSDIKTAIKGKVNSLSNDKQFLLFYKWIFRYAKEDEKKKTIPKELALQLWKIVLDHKKSSLALLKPFSEFVEKNEECKAISRDVWEQTYDFLKETKKASDYDDGGAWPVLIDEFIEDLREKEAK